MPRPAPGPPPPRPPSAASSSTASSSLSLASGGAPAARPGPGPVSLRAPRPDGERLANEYVETPLRAAQGPPAAPRVCAKAAAAAATPRGRAAARAPPGPVTKQPVSFTKEPAAGQPAAGGRPGEGPSIMCERCGRCRCESCREPPPLPSRWLCDNACLCSAETALDCASCLCCVKGLFYHCAEGGAGAELRALGGPADPELAAAGPGDCADEPCSCAAGGDRAARWSCLGALALLLPCLLCYWPLRACVGLCELCYAKHATQGCRCEPRGPAPRQPAEGPPAAAAPTATAAARDSRDPEKRLLEPAGPEL